MALCILPYSTDLSIYKCYITGVSIYRKQRHTYYDVIICKPLLCYDVTHLYAIKIPYLYIFLLIMYLYLLMVVKYIIITDFCIGSICGKIGYGPCEIFKYLKRNAIHPELYISNCILFWMCCFKEEVFITVKDDHHRTDLTEAV